MLWSENNCFYSREISQYWSDRWIHQSCRTWPGSKVTHGIESKSPKTAGHLTEGLTNQRARLDHVRTAKHMLAQLELERARWNMARPCGLSECVETPGFHGRGPKGNLAVTAKTRLRTGKPHKITTMVSELPVSSHVEICHIFSRSPLSSFLPDRATDWTFR